ncbi:hypothetical protein SAMN04487830_1428 [Pseudobutyrivibrio sp. OR37]|uniref:hypothetical protein n=1 Tax=Pseudobutyrivibrio sp. OR37 TaxID=1798186 RepID=UPI0008ED1B3A|nr:hypothetical protein [Pseudobutyrivibrio sp. OR37]SFI32164.1 hypothetical protein SAMN04487830_1428 [Pseudobutyrivibrio sp. OR37]
MRINNIKRKKLVIAFCVVFVASFIALFLRKPIEIDLLGDTPEFNTESPVYDYVGYSDGSIDYNAVWSENISIDFSNSVNAAYLSIKNIPFGMYYLYIDYDTEYDVATDNNPITYLSLSGRNKDKFEMEDVKLYDYKKWVETPLWVKSVQGSDEMNLNFSFTGYGKTQIHSLILKESKLWKLGFLLTELIVFSVISVLYYKLKEKSPEDRIWIVGIIAFAIFVSLPAFIGNSLVYYVEWQDYEFHANRIASIANELRYGNFPALYQSDALNGYGYVSLLMYGNIFLYIPAVLHLLGYTISACYNIYVLLINLVTITISMFSFKAIFKERKYALLGTVLYMLAAYRLCNVYVRSAVGEYTAMAFLPLIIAGIYRLYFEIEKPKFRDCIPLILGVSGIIESHVLTVEMLAWFIFAFAIIYIKRTIKIILVLIESIISVLLLNCFFIVPFLDTFKQGLSVNADNISANLQSSGISIGQLFNLFMTDSGVNIDYGTRSEMPLTLGFSLVLGLLLFAVVCCYKNTWDMSVEEKQHWSVIRTVCIFAVLTLWLSTSYFPWKDLAYKQNSLLILLTSVQFVWRYLALATIFITIVTVYSVQIIEKREIRLFSLNPVGNRISVVLGALAIIIAGHFFTGFMNNAVGEKNLDISSNIWTDALYLPAGMDSTILYDTSVKIDPQNSVSIMLHDTDRKNNKIYNVNKVKENCTVSFPVAYYDYLEVHDLNTGEVFNTISGYNQRLSVTLDKGYNGKLVITYRVRKLWKLAYLVSGVSLILFGAYCLKKR